MYSFICEPLVFTGEFFCFLWGVAVNKFYSNKFTITRAINIASGIFISIISVVPRERYNMYRGISSHARGTNADLAQQAE